MLLSVGERISTMPFRLVVLIQYQCRGQTQTPSCSCTRIKALTDKSLIGLKSHDRFLMGNP